MEAVLYSFLLVFASEMGDKTQLLALVLVARYRKPWTILLGVLIATILNHALAAVGGAWVASLLEPRHLSWVLAAIFIVFGFWILIPDKEEEVGVSSRFGVLLTTIVAFFIAEMGDKTQLATVALGAKYTSVVLVTIGSTAGMLGSNALAVFLGQRLLQRISMTWVRRTACVLFLAFGLLILIGY